MFVSKHNGKEYCFHEDHMTIDGVALDYSRMTDIAHKAGDTPAIVFTYDGNRITMPYNKEDYRAVLPYFINANRRKSAEETPAEPEFVYEPEAPAEPEFVYEPEAATETQQQTEPEFVYEPEVYDAPVEQEVYTEPEAVVEPEAYEAPVEQEVYTEPEAVVEPETPAETKTKAAKAAGLGAKIGSIKNLPKKKLIIIAAIMAAIIVAIVAFVGLAGKSVEGIDGGVDTKTVKTNAGDTIKMSQIDDDVSVDEYALNYYNSCFKEGDTVHWIYNKATNQTILFADQDGTVLVCVYEHVDGDEEDPSLLGMGTLEETWLLYPETGEMIPV